MISRVKTLSGLFFLDFDPKKIKTDTILLEILDI